MSKLIGQMQLHCKKLCNEILDIDPNIRFVGLINDKGRLI